MCWWWRLKWEQLEQRGSEGEEETDQVIWRVKKGHNKEHLHIFIFTSNTLSVRDRCRATNSNVPIKLSCLHLRCVHTDSDLIHAVTMSLYCWLLLNVPFIKILIEQDHLKLWLKLTVYQFWIIYNFSNVKSKALKTQNTQFYWEIRTHNNIWLNYG